MDDEREWGSTERGFLLHAFLLKRPRKVSEIAALLGYTSHSGASNLLYRMRAAQRVGVVSDVDLAVQRLLQGERIFLQQYSPIVSQVQRTVQMALQKAE